MSPSSRKRRTGATALAVLSGVLLLAATLVGYADRTILDSNRFADRAVATLKDESVRELLSERITDDVVLARDPDLLAARPLIQEAAEHVVTGRAFTRLFRAAVADLHRAVFRRDRDTVTFTITDVGLVLQAALAVAPPEIAEKVGRDPAVSISTHDLGERTADLARAADRVDSLAFILLAATLLAVIGTLVVAPDRRRAAWQLGAAVLVAGVLVVVSYSIAETAVTNRIDGAEEHAASEAVWSAFFGDLRTAGWVLAGIGAVVMASASSLLRPVDATARLRQGWAVVAREPGNPWLRTLRGLALIALGLLVVLDPGSALTLLATAVGVFLLFEGVEAVLRVVQRAPGAEPVEGPSVPGRRRAVLAWAGAAVLIAVGVGAFLGGGGTSAPEVAAANVTTCNGHAELCDRPFDEVTLAATHNSMAVPLPGWFSIEQDHPIKRQLEAGVRGLLIDTHYGDKLANNRVRTEIGDDAKLRQALNPDGLSDEAVEAALRLRSRAGFQGEGERGTYLCHTFCELGNTPLEEALDDLAAFLTNNPGEVVTVINEDYITPEDFVAAMTAAGLDRLAYRGPTGKGEWPTLGEMIRDDQRLVVLAENHAGAAAWYRPAYTQITEETPFTFKKVALLNDPKLVPASCRPNRGPESAPLFLINHWISTDPLPRPSDALKVNALAPLLRRAQECERIRDHRVNLLAVNFYARGDTFGVVDALNGLPPRGA